MLVESQRCNGRFYGDGLLLLYKAPGVYQRIGVFSSLDEETLQLVSKRKRAVLEGNAQPPAQSLAALSLDNTFEGQGYDTIHGSSRNDIDDNLGEDPEQQSIMII
jgi:hypothetical protein